MNRYRHLITSLLTLCALLALTATAWAATKPQDPGESENGPLTGPNCDLTGYKSEQRSFPTPGLAVPDNNATGVTTPPIAFAPDGMLIDDVIVDLTMAHTWVGDLRVTLRYDALCDGTIDASATVLCRPRGTGTTTPAPCGTGTGLGCSADLTAASTLLWSDDAVAPLAEGTCANPVPGGCYKPTAVGGQPLSVFRGLPKNGCFTLFVSDHAGGDVGSIVSWSVHVRNRIPTGACCLLDAGGGCLDNQSVVDCLAQHGIYLGDGTVCTPTICATSAVRKSWGTIKAIYR